MLSRIFQIPVVLISLGVVLFFLPTDGYSASTLQYSWNLDTNPGWPTEGLWAFGQPSGGGGGGEFGDSCPDPTSGYTGTNVYGYNLSGDYENNLPEKHLTTTALDCSGLTNVRLEFRRWLGVEGSNFDHAYVSVSANGNLWTKVWSNPAEDLLGDPDNCSWTQETVDISSVADGQSTVYIQWIMGTTDGSVNFCGWNIDDVEIWGEAASAPTAVTALPSQISEDSATLNGIVNPGGAQTTVFFDYGKTLPYGNIVTAAQSPLSGATGQNVSAQISGLDPGTTYHYRVRATNEVGTSNGVDASFSTDSGCPACSGTEVNLSGANFPKGFICECIATVYINIGADVTVESGADVTFQAPSVTVSPAFHAEEGSTVHITQ